MRLFRALERVDTALTAQQYRILRLAGAGGERSARLAERLAVAKPTLTATADGLVAAGYAQREAEPSDRRGGRVGPAGGGPHRARAGRRGLRRLARPAARRDRRRVRGARDLPHPGCGDG